ncbi:PqqD family peptide modification chaperone [Sphaerobacter sp.]|uniref:PqqD family peptide modification chaperone n=1 Tax=Sphaerobacter sp. TaxID=2099654 RepID=UPI001DAD57DF|nr:PqqD family peptide modification chaperone [Sphaerobacter sp.]MBX5444736.1 hypothetical protein [Sphaerobacter sp.]
MEWAYGDATGNSAHSVDIGVIQALIARHIDPETTAFGPEYARLRDSGLAVWRLVAGMDPSGDSIEDLAEDYEVPEESVLAALYFYWQHRDAIDARIARVNLPPAV